MRIGIIGTGYVGLVAGAGFADFGNDVICADVNADKIARLNRGEIPIYEPGLQALIEKNRQDNRITFTTDVDRAVSEPEIVFIAVGTPPGPDGSADLSQVFAVAKAFGRNLAPTAPGKRPKVIATKSTVPVGTADRVRDCISELTQHPFFVASNPEFLKEGDAINDFMKPDRVVIGTDDADALATLRQLYAPFVRTSDRILTMDARSAELTKYAANAMLATRISFMNDLAQLAEKVGADIESIRKGVGSDPRVGNKFLFPGPGFGGSCFPKDLAALTSTGREAGHALAIVEATERVNATQKHHLARKIKSHFGDSLRGRRLALWGLAFKPETDDIRESPALVAHRDLRQAGAQVTAYDPQAMPSVKRELGDEIDLVEDMYAAAEGADALILVTEWRQFRAPDFARLKGLLKTPVLFDGRNIWPRAELARLGFTVYSIGRPTLTPDGSSGREQ